MIIAIIIIGIWLIFIGHSLIRKTTKLIEIFYEQNETYAELNKKVGRIEREFAPGGFFADGIADKWQKSVSFE